MQNIWNYSPDGDEVETKVNILGENIIAKNAIESDDEQNVVDHLSPQTLLETPADSEVQYSLRSPEGKPLTSTWLIFFIQRLRIIKWYN